LPGPKVRFFTLFKAQGKIIPLHPNIIHASLIKIIPDIYDINYKPKKRGEMSKIIQGTQN